MFSITKFLKVINKKLDSNLAEVEAELEEQKIINGYLKAKQAYTEGTNTNIPKSSLFISYLLQKDPERGCLLLGEIVAGIMNFNNFAVIQVKLNFLLGTTDFNINRVVIELLLSQNFDRIYLENIDIFKAPSATGSLILTYKGIDLNVHFYITTDSDSGQVDSISALFDKSNLLNTTKPEKALLQ